MRDELLGDKLRERKRIVGDELFSHALGLERPVLAVQHGEERVVCVAFGATAAAEFREHGSTGPIRDVPVPATVPPALYARRRLQEANVHARNERMKDRAGQRPDARRYRTGLSAVEDHDFPGDSDTIRERHVDEPDLGSSTGVDDHVVRLGVASNSGGRGKERELLKH